MAKLTEEELKRASEIAVAGMKEPSIAFVKAMKASNKALTSKPLADKLSGKDKEKLKKLVKRKK